MLITMRYNIMFFNIMCSCIIMALRSRRETENVEGERYDCVEGWVVGGVRCEFLFFATIRTTDSASVNEDRLSHISPRNPPC